MLNMDIAKLCQAKTLLGGSDSLIITIGPSGVKPARPVLTQPDPEQFQFAMLGCHLEGVEKLVWS